MIRISQTVIALPIFHFLAACARGNTMSKETSLNDGGAGSAYTKAKSSSRTVDGSSQRAGSSLLLDRARGNAVLWVWRF